MEKKTIGKFISVLRRANGMTQKELGERLFVSDKTVSRWERDECTPELSLIPAIAEIFGITTDELLRGERYNQTDECMIDEAMQERAKRKSEKQLKNLLHGRFVNYQNMSLISVGIAITGGIAAMICNLGFARGILGFSIGCIFLLISIIFQICNVTTKLIPVMEEDEKQQIEIRKTNTKIIKGVVWVVLINAGILGFILPVALFSEGGYTGLAFRAWVGYGAVGMLLGVILTYTGYVFCIRDRLMNNERFLIDIKYQEWMAADKKLLKKTFKMTGTIALVLGAIAIIVSSLDAHLFVKPVVFETIPEFQAYMLENQNTHYDNGMDVIISESVGILANEQAVDNLEYSANNINEGVSWSQALDRDGNVMFSYAAGDFYYLIKSDVDDGVPIEVYLKRDQAIVWQIQDAVATVLMWLVVVEFVGGIGCYVMKTKKVKENCNCSIK